MAMMAVVSFSHRDTMNRAASRKRVHCDDVGVEVVVEVGNASPLTAWKKQRVKATTRQRLERVGAICRMSVKVSGFLESY